MISEILPSSSGYRFNPFKKCGNPFASDRCLKFLESWFGEDFFGSLCHWRGCKAGRNGMNGFCRPSQHLLCLWFDLGHSLSLGTEEEDCARHGHVTAAVVVITICHPTTYSVQRHEVSRERVSCGLHIYEYLVLAKAKGLVSWETANSAFHSRLIHACVDFSTGPHVQAHKSLAKWGSWESLKISQQLHWIGLNTSLPQRCKGK